MKGKEIKENQLNQLRIYFRKEKKRKKEKKKKEKKTNRKLLEERIVDEPISKQPLYLLLASAICLFDQVIDLSLKATSLSSMH